MSCFGCPRLLVNCIFMKLMGCVTRPYAEILPEEFREETTNYIIIAHNCSYLVGARVYRGTWTQFLSCKLGIGRPNHTGAGPAFTTRLLEDLTEVWSVHLIQSMKDYSLTGLASVTQPDKILPRGLTDIWVSAKEYGKLKLVPRNRQDCTQIINHIHLLPFIFVPSLFNIQCQLVQTALSCSVVISSLLLVLLPLSIFSILSILFSFSKAFPNNIGWPDLWDFYVSVSWELGLFLMIWLDSFTSLFLFCF